MKYQTLITHLFLCFSACAQSVDRLLESYTGEVIWDEESKVVTFTKSGFIDFDKEDYFEHFWDVPETVSEIVIGDGVAVTGAFHTHADCVIRGVSRNDSILHGTPLRDWTGPLEVIAWRYSLIENKGGTLRIENLTMLNPFGFFVRGSGTVIHVSKCNFIDNRGGNQNHSDGFVGGHGSSVEDSYFECGDDVFKAYFDYSVTNCTVRMIHNTVPIQMGWGNYSDGSLLEVKNLKVLGDSGRRSSANPVISGRRGDYLVTVEIDGAWIENPYASLISLWGEDMVLSGYLQNAWVSVESYNGKTAGRSQMDVCEGVEAGSVFQCGDYEEAKNLPVLREPIDVSQLDSSDLRSFFAENFDENLVTMAERAIQSAAELKPLVGLLIPGAFEGDFDFGSGTVDGVPINWAEVRQFNPGEESPVIGIPEYASNLAEKRFSKKDHPILLVRALYERANYIDAVSDQGLELFDPQIIAISFYLKAYSRLAYAYAAQIEAQAFLEIGQKIPEKRTFYLTEATKGMQSSSKYWLEYFDLSKKGSHGLKK